MLSGSLSRTCLHEWHTCKKKSMHMGAASPDSVREAGTIVYVDDADANEMVSESSCNYLSKGRLPMYYPDHL
jgi:hypothetical protein